MRIVKGAISVIAVVMAILVLGALLTLADSAHIGHIVLMAITGLFDVVLIAIASAAVYHLFFKRED